MARVGLTAEHMREAGGSKFVFHPGLGRVENVTTAVEAMGGFTACGLRVTVQRLDKNLKPTEDEPVTQFLPLANVATRDGEPLFHPGEADGPDDDDPKDLGDEVDTEGNALWAASDELKFDKNLGGSHFLLSLAEHGFKQSLLTGYMPVFVGMVAEFDQKLLQEAKVKADGKKGNPITALVVKKILEFPYEKGGSGAAKSGKGTSAASGKAAAKPAADAGDGGDGDEEVKAKAMECLVAVGEKLAGQTVTKAKVDTTLIPTFAKLKVAPKDQKAVTALVKDAEWFAEAAEAMGWEIDGGKVAIPEA